MDFDAVFRRNRPHAVRQTENYILVLRFLQYFGQWHEKYEFVQTRCDTHSHRLVKRIHISRICKATVTSGLISSKTHISSPFFSQTGAISDYFLQQIRFSICIMTQSIKLRLSHDANKLEKIRWINVAAIGGVLHCIQMCWCTKLAKWPWRHMIHKINADANAFRIEIHRSSTNTKIKEETSRWAGKIGCCRRRVY